MASTIEKSPDHPLLKTHKLHFASQISLRILSFFATVVATWIMLTNKQTSIVFGVEVQAHYNYSSAFKFFAIANLIVCAFSLISLFFAIILGTKPVDPTYYFYMFLHDLVISLLLMAGCAAATAVGYIGKYGNEYTGWMPICDHFAKFCHKSVAAVVLSYFAMLFYIVLTVISARRSTQISV